MRLIINKSKIVTEDFIKYVIYRMKIYGKSYIDSNPKRLVKLDEYLKQRYRNCDERLSAHDLIFLGLENIISHEFDDSFVIEINPNKCIPYFDKSYLFSYCALADRGNVSVKGTYVFTKTFRYALNSLHSFAYMYSIQKKLKRRNM